MTEEKSNEQLSKEEIAKIKEELLERKNKIIEDLKDITEENGGGKVKFPEYGDKNDENAQEIGEYSTNLATDKVLESTLKDINSALERIENGTYGVCKYCGNYIAKKRLLARPVASACIACKTKLQSGL